MITERDLQEAIAECQGVRNPDAHTCVMLAAFLTIQRELYSTNTVSEVQGYSFSAEKAAGDLPKIQYDSGTKFALAVNGKELKKVLKVLDEFVGFLAGLHRQLYDALVDELNQI